MAADYWATTAAFYLWPGHRDGTAFHDSSSHSHKPELPPPTASGYHDRRGPATVYY